MNRIITENVTSNENYKKTSFIENNTTTTMAAIV